MPHQNKNNRDISYEEILELSVNEGFEALPDSLRLLLNAAMRMEREKYLGAAAYERSEQRRGYANGFKSKTVQSRVGPLELEIPQTRDGGFYPSSLERGLRSEKALKLALAEMYVQGVSTRKVAAITEELCGFEISSTQVSRVARELDEVLTAWRNRPLGHFPYVYLDARYEKVRHGGIVRDCAVLIAVGVTPSIIVGVYEPATSSSGSTKRSAGERRWHASFQTKRHACGLSLRCSWKSPKTRFQTGHSSELKNRWR